MATKEELHEKLKNGVVEYEEDTVKDASEKLKNGVVEYEEDTVKDASQAVLDEGYDALEAIMNGLAAGMEKVGELYEAHEYFVPEVLMCADALYGGLAILRPHVPDKEGGVNAQVVIGSIQGDVHDIGKNLVKMMFDVAGWDVHDLGRFGSSGHVGHDDHHHAGDEKSHCHDQGEKPKCGDHARWCAGDQGRGQSFRC